MRTLRSASRRFDTGCQFQVHDLLQLLAAQRIEQHDVVDPVEELRDGTLARNASIASLRARSGSLARQIEERRSNRRCWS